ncbi:unnamed protein product [Musa textilis]
MNTCLSYSKHTMVPLGQCIFCCFLCSLDLFIISVAGICMLTLGMTRWFWSGKMINTKSRRARTRVCVRERERQQMPKLYIVKNLLSNIYVLVAMNYHAVPYFYNIFHVIMPISCHVHVMLVSMLYVWF